MKPVLEGRTEDSRVEALSTTAMVEGDSKEEGEKTPSMDPPATEGIGSLYELMSTILPEP